MPAKIDISGNRYGVLTVICDSGLRSNNKKVLWHCKCDCGNEVDVGKDFLTNPYITPSCGCESKKKKIQIGYKIGRLKVEKCLGSNGEKIEWECVCECGNRVIHTTSELNAGHVKSCGCLKLETGEKLKKYNARDRKLYFRWNDIRGRCYNPKNQAYKNYGGRGIKMCPEWENDFYAFRDWAITHGYEEWLSIDRKDNDGDYSPYNCRWVDRKVQGNNRRSNHYITIDGVEKTMKQWASEYNIDYNLILRRIKKGMSDVEAVTTPVRHKLPNGQGAKYKKNHS